MRTVSTILNFIQYALFQQAKIMATLVGIH